MAWIKTIDEADATGELAELYDAIVSSRGKVSNIMKVHSLNPEAMKAHLDLYQTLLFGRSELQRPEREAIAVVVSAANGCPYCTRHHAEALKAYWKDEDRVQQMTENYRELDDLPEKLRAACDYAIRLTRAPDTMASSDVKALYEAGWDDRDVLDITLIASYFNFVNRIANGLGVQFTPEEATGYEY